MPPITRRSLAGAAALPLFTIRSCPADAAGFTCEFADNLPAAHPMNLRANEAAARIGEAMGGRVKVRVLLSNQLRSGAVEFFTMSGLILSTLAPAASISGVGFAFKDYGQVRQAMDGTLGEHVRGEVAKRGLLAMDRIWDNGYRQTTTSSTANGAASTATPRGAFWRRPWAACRERPPQTRPETHIRVTDRRRSRCPCLQPRPSRPSPTPSPGRMPSGRPCSPRSSTR